jgi:hypothetical protein
MGKDQLFFRYVRKVHFASPLGFLFIWPHKSYFSLGKHHGLNSFFSSCSSFARLPLGSSATKSNAFVAVVPVKTFSTTRMFWGRSGNSIGFQNFTLVDGKFIWSIFESTYGIYRIEAIYVGDDTFQGSEAPSYVRTGLLVDYGDAPTAAQILVRESDIKPRNANRPTASK